MCDSDASRTPGWKGWLDLPAPTLSGAGGAWVDLSHRVTETLSRIPFFPQPRIQRIITWPPANVTEIQMVVHHGTHIDAPRHFIADGPAIDEIPLDRFYGPGVVWRIDAPSRGAIDVADLERATPQMRRGDIVFIDTGWWEKVNTEDYEEHPFLTGAAAQWLVAQGARIVGMDNSTPDMASHYRPKDFDYPVHRTLLSHGVLIAEHMTNLTPLAGRRIEAMALAINLAGSDGAPARIVARPVG